MSNLFRKCITELEDSLTLINKLIPNINIKQESNLLELVASKNFNYRESESLINKCDIVCQHYINNKKPVIRVIHHFACSGGSLISKCIASMPNVYLLSEVHPYSSLHMLDDELKYLPSDISTLAKYSNIPELRTLTKNIFTSSIKITYQHLKKIGSTLVLRDHAHADFCTSQEDYRVHSVVDALSDDFEIISLISLRDPIDSYLSLVSNDWLHFAPQTFNEYCKRLIHFLESYPDSQVILFENFITKTRESMQLICDKLEIESNELFESLFQINTVTGDSGRGGTIIRALERKNISNEFKKEIITSKFYGDCISYIEKRLELPQKRTNYIPAKSFK